MSPDTDPKIIVKGNCAQLIQWPDGWLALEETPEYREWIESIFGKPEIHRLTGRIPNA